MGTEVTAPTSSELDLMNTDAVMDYFHDNRPDVVLHLAARVGGIQANMAEPARFLIENVQMDSNVIAAASAVSPRHMMVMLSTCMYPDRLADDRYPMTEEQVEDGPPPPTNASYAAAKRTLLHAAKALEVQYSIPFTALIPSNLYGPRDHYGSEASHFLAAAVTKIETARAGSEPSVEFFGTGSALRQFLFVSDLARLIAAIVKKGPLNEPLNVAPTHNLSIKELAEAVADAADFTGEVRFSGQGPDGQYRKDVSSDRLSDLVPEWAEIETPLPEGLKATIDWYRANVAAG